MNTLTDKIKSVLSDKTLTVKEFNVLNTFISTIFVSDTASENHINSIANSLELPTSSIRATVQSLQAKGILLLTKTETGNYIEFAFDEYEIFSLGNIDSLHPDFQESEILLNENDDDMEATVEMTAMDNAFESIINPQIVERVKNFLNNDLSDFIQNFDPKSPVTQQGLKNFKGACYTAIVEHSLLTRDKLAEIYKVIYPKHDLDVDLKRHQRILNRLRNYMK